VSKKLLSKFALLFALAIILAACGDGNGPADEGAAEPTPTPADTAEEEETEPTEPTDEETTPAADGEEVVIAYQGPLTGDYAALGQNMIRGVELAVMEATEAGDLDFTITVRQFDSQGSPDQSPALANQIAADESIVAVVGPSFSGETNAAGPIFEQAGVPFVSPSATNPDLSDQGWTHFFRTVATDATQGPVVARFIADNLGATSVAVVDDSSDYGKGLADIVEESLEENDVEIVYRSGVEAGQQDFSAVVGQIAQSGAEAVFFGGYYAEAGLIRRQLVDQGAGDIQFVSDDGTFDPEFITTAGAAAAEGSFVSFPGADPLSADPEFLEAYRSEFDADPGAFTIEAYQNTLLIIEALKEVGTDRAAIRDFIDDFSGEIFGKQIEFDDNGDIAAQAFFIYEVVDGEWVQREAVTAD
jgi:branched-chain amino acid transport system substrate-binding protein